MILVMYEPGLFSEYDKLDWQRHFKL